MPRTIENRRVKTSHTTGTKRGTNVDFFDGKRSIAKLGAGDSFYIHDFVKSKREREQLFSEMLNEINFQQMYNFGKEVTEVFPIPRLIAAQTSEMEDGETAIYRMPGCNERNIPTSAWTPTVARVRDEASSIINQKLNHCVATLFRDENDSLAFHQDKVLDLKEKSLILSVSFGAPRPIQFHSMKKGRQHKQTIMLQPGSLLAIGPRTNRGYQHAIPKVEDSVGPRISLSIRTITSIMKKGEDEGGYQIVGQGEEYQNRNYPFVTSYDDPDRYPETIQQQMREYQERANRQLAGIRGKVARELEAQTSITTTSAEAPSKDIDSAEESEIYKV